MSELDVDAQPQPRRPGAPRGKPKTPEHRARIAAGVRRWYESAEPWRKRRGFRRLLSDEEAQDYQHLRHRHGYGQAEALAAIDRGDLIGEGAEGLGYPPSGGKPKE